MNKALHAARTLRGDFTMASNCKFLVIVTFLVTPTTGTAQDQAPVKGGLAEIESIRQAIARNATGHLHLVRTGSYLSQDHKQWTENEWGTEDLVWATGSRQSIRRSITVAAIDREIRRGHLMHELVNEKEIYTLQYTVRKPTQPEIAERDFEWITESNEDDVVLNQMLYFDGENARKFAKQLGGSQFEIIDGEWQRATGFSGKLLDYIVGSKALSINRVAFLAKPCLELQSGDTDRGRIKLIVCPELNYSPVYFSRTCDKADFLSEGVRVGQAHDGAGHAANHYERVVQMADISHDQSMLTIEETAITKYAGGGQIGQRNVSHATWISRNITSDELELSKSLPNGTPVEIYGKSQLKAEFRDGQVVRVYDGEIVKVMADVQMREPPKRWALFAISLPAALSALFYYWYRQANRQ